MRKSFIQAGKKERNELYLPALRYVVADDWIDKLGPDAFIAWLKFHSWVDRTDEKREYDRVPYSLEDTWEKLGMGKKKFYQKVLRPLWEYGLVDVIEYEDSERASQKPKNIIVYTAPANAHENEIKPLVKLRDWDKDYGSESQFYGKKGGRPKKQGGDSTEPSSADHGFQMETVEGTVSKRKRLTVSKQKPWTVSERKPNNTTNTSTNTPNTSNNDTNQQQQGGPAADQNVVVVVEPQKLIEDLFGKTLKETEIQTLIKLAKKHGKDLAQCIRDAKEYIVLKKESVTSLMGLLRYSIEIGFDLESLKEQLKEQQRPAHEEDLPFAIRMQMEQQNAQPVQPQDDEPLEAKQARIRAKLKLMNEKLGVNQNP